MPNDQDVKHKCKRSEPPKHHNQQKNSMARKKSTTGEVDKKGKSRPARQAIVIPKGFDIYNLVPVKSRELRGSQLYTDCDCYRRNGLQDDCPREDCGGEHCLTQPWPECPLAQHYLQKQAKHNAKLDALNHRPTVLVPLEPDLEPRYLEDEEIDEKPEKKKATKNKKSQATREDEEKNCTETVNVTVLTTSKTECEKKQRPENPEKTCKKCGK